MSSSSFSAPEAYRKLPLFSDSSLFLPWYTLPLSLSLSVSLCLSLSFSLFLFLTIQSVAGSCVPSSPTFLQLCLQSRLLFRLVLDPQTLHTGHCSALSFLSDRITHLLSHGLTLRPPIHCEFLAGLSSNPALRFDATRNNVVQRPSIIIPIPLFGPGGNTSRWIRIHSVEIWNQIVI
jgi:hypothetical protein